MSNAPKNFIRNNTIFVWWANNLPYYLQEYNVLEIIALIILLFMFNEHAQFLMNHYKEMNQWQMAAMAQFPLAIWGMIGTVWKSINTELTYPELKERNEVNGDDPS